MEMTMNRLASALLFVTLSVSPVWAADPAGVGEDCGGVANVKCEPHLFCQLPATGGTLGKCMKKAKLGEVCGGIGHIECEEGLKCMGMADNPDATGKCSIVN
jgi:hypothetical protein